MSTDDFADCLAHPSSDYVDSVFKGDNNDDGDWYGDKDLDEEQLEELVLGNSAGFRQNLFQKNSNFEDDEPFHEPKRQVPNLEKVNDSSLFIIDTGPSLAKETRVEKLASTNATAAIPSATTNDAPAWYDSDDERFAISLAKNNRLRKLRETEADDIVDGVEYTRRLRLQYLRLAPTPAWALPAHSQRKERRKSRGDMDSPDSDAGSDSDSSALPLEAFLRDVRQMAGVGKEGKRKLQPEVIDIQRRHDIPQRQGMVSRIAFHPKYPVLLHVGKSSVLNLNHIAPTAHPEPNPSLTSVQIMQMPILNAEFLGPRGDKIVFAGAKRYFHSWDLASGAVTKITKVQGQKFEHKSFKHFRLSRCGRWMAIKGSVNKGGGVVNILNAETMQWLAQARVDSRGGIVSFEWWSNGEGLTILGVDGSVGEWSLESKRILGVWTDDGSVGGTVVALGGRGGPSVLGGDRWVAIGSNSGILNIYDRFGLIASSLKGTVQIKGLPTPKKVFEHIITKITLAAFSPDGQLLAYGSEHKKDALKLVHVPSCTVYRNWPTGNTPLGRITALAFSKSGDQLAVGNDAGKIRMWEIRA